MTDVRGLTIAVIRRHGDPTLFRDAAVAAGTGALAATVVARAAAPQLGLALVAVLAAAMPGTGRVRDLTYFALPLYGRELARAHAVAPVLASLAAPCAYAAVAAALGHPVGAAAFAIAALAAAVTALVNLGAQFRTGAARHFYDALAYAAGFAVETGLLPIAPWVKAAAAGLAVVLAYAALRQLGETLARYDPLPEGIA